MSTTKTPNVPNPIIKQKPVSMDENDSKNTENTKIIQQNTIVKQQILTKTQPIIVNRPNTNSEGTKQSPIKKSTNTNTSIEDQKENEEKVDLNNLKSNLIINYIPPTMNEGQLASLFSPYGTMEHIKIVVDPNTGRSRGYGFIKYKNEESATRALKALNGTQAGSKRLKVAYARVKCKEIQNANLYITNIPLHWTEKNISPLFVEFGTIIECRILKNEEGNSRGVGFVRMDTHMNAIKAMEGRDRYKPEGNEPALVVKLAQRRNNRNRWQSGQNNRGRQNKSPTKMDPMITPNQNYPMTYRNSNNRNSPQRNKQFYRPRGQFTTSNQNRQYRVRSGQGGQTTSGFYPFHDAYQAIGNNNTPNTQQSSNTGGTSGSGGGTSGGTSNSRNFSNATFNIIVYNIPQSYNVDHLIQLYAPYGPIQSVNIQKPSPNPTQKGQQQQVYGVISYFYFDDAQRAQSQTHGKRVGDRRLEVVFQRKS